MKKDFLFLFFLLVLGISALAFAYSKRSDCFSPSFIVTEEAISFPPSMSSLSEKSLSDILSQPFTFLGSGNQSFAFESEDKMTVIKFIKFHSLLGFSWEDLLPSISPFLKIKERKADEKAFKLKRILNGFDIAARLDRENCGLLALHSPGDLSQEIHLQDKAGRNHLINLKNVFFVLQEKAVPTGVVLSQHLNEGNFKAAEEKISSLFEMYQSEFRKGVYDQDHNVIHNTGFVKDTPIRIDFGKLSVNREMENEENADLELKKIAKERILPWVKRYHPHYLQEMTNFLDSKKLLTRS